MTPRQQRIVQLLTDTPALRVRELAASLGVSEMTVRRDLDALTAAGAVTRTHGAAALERGTVLQFAFQQKQSTNEAAKRAIAAEVARMIRPGATVSLDTGTTTLEVARRLRSVRDLRVLTTSLAIASVLYGADGVEVVLLGGTMRRGSPDLSGALTEENVRRFRVDMAVLGADGADRGGVYTTDTGIAGVSRAMIGGARETVLAADASKFAAPAFVRIAPWNSIHCVVSDTALARPVRTWLRQAVPCLTLVRAGNNDGGRRRD